MSDPIKIEENFDVRSVVRERYGTLAEKARSYQQTGGGCEPAQAQSSCCGSTEDPVQLSMVSKLYEARREANEETLQNLSTEERILLKRLLRDLV